MNRFRAVLTASLVPRLGEGLRELGFAKSGTLAWRRQDLEVRVVVDSKARDPFRGGAFTLEFERSDDGRFGRKLAGRVRFDQLLDREQAAATLRHRNVMAIRLPRPDEEHLARVPEFLRHEYLKPFEAADELGPRFWMRFRTNADVDGWADLVIAMLPSLLKRAQSVDPHVLLLGERLSFGDT